MNEQASVIGETDSSKAAETARASGRGRGGFTLIEVLIVLAIVLALTAIVGVAVFGRRDQATSQLAEVDLKAIQRSMDQFRLDFGRYPTDEEGVAVLWDADLLDADADPATYLAGGYMTEAKPLDAWNNEWNYRAESEYDDDYDLWSNGPDGEEGTEDDIVSWNEEDGDGDFGFGPEAGGSVPPAPAP